MALVVALGSNAPGGDTDSGQKFNHVWGTLTFSSTYATGGEAFDALLAALLSGFPKVKPAYVWMVGINGYTYQYVKSTGKIKVSTTANTELSAGAYPAGITGDVVTFEADIPKY